MIRLLAWALAAMVSCSAVAADNDQPAPSYRIQPGDGLQVSVWHEAELQRDVVVLPDGWIALPLVGEIQAAGKTVSELRVEVTQRLAQFIPDANVTVAVLQPLGNKIFVLGKVNRPGDFAMVRPLDVLQALTMAGGTARFAELGQIVIVRREGDKETTLSFDYGAVAQGQNLDQNIVLRAGDVVVVP